MDPQRDPVRWLDAASDAPSELRRVLESAAGDGGGADGLASLASKLPLSAGAVAGAGGTGAGSAGAAAAGATKKVILSWKLAVWIAGGAAGIGAATNAVMVGLPEEPAPVVAAGGPGAASESAGTAAPGEMVTVAPSGSSDAVSARSVKESNAVSALSSKPVIAAPATGGRGGAGGATARDGQPPAPREAGDSLAAEAKVLLAAKEALAKSPQKALAAADEHGAAFGGGALAEEREVIRIEALVRLGRRDEAAAAAAAFRARHPRSTHLARVERLVR